MKALRNISILLLVFLTISTQAQDEVVGKFLQEIVWNLSPNSKDEINLLKPTDDPTQDVGAWQKPEVDSLDLYIIRPIDLGFGRGYAYNDFIRKVLDLKFSTCPRWVPIQSYLTIKDRDEALWFCMTPITTKNGSGVYCVGPKKKRSGSVVRNHDLFLSSHNEDPTIPWVFTK